MNVDPPELDQDDADAVAEANAEREARAKAFQAWWSGPFGDNYRNIHRKVGKAEALDAFRAGWLAVLDALAPEDEDEGVNDWVGDLPATDA